MRTGNPALNDRSFSFPHTVDSSDLMTIQGTVNKTFILVLLTILTAGWTWSHPASFMMYYLPALIGGFVIGIVTIFKKDWAPVTAPIYALLEGIILGGVSFVSEKIYPGIVMQAVGLTFGTLFALLAVYKSGLIKVSDNFRLGIFAATGGIALYYFVGFILGFFHIQVPLITDSGPIGIGFSIFVVIIAALNLVLDFDFIEHGAQNGAPRYMEWYGAFGLIVTLIWLYLEILRLLAKTRRR